MGNSRRGLASVVLVTVALLAALICPATEASALTANQNYINQVHRDFLLRDPSADEMTWWTAYLSGGTRTGMLSSIISSLEFTNLWVVSVFAKYLDEVDFDDPALATEISNLTSTGNFLATEVAVLSSATYYANNGGTNTSFVEAVYNDVLLRASDPSGLAYWVNRLNAGTSTRASLASSFLRTTEAATRRVSGAVGLTACPATEFSDDDPISAGSYCIILNRLSDTSGATYWIGQLSGSGQLPDLWSALAVSNEYYNNAQL